MSEIIALERLKNGFFGVSPIVGAAHLEACLVCLGHNRHLSGVKLAIEGTNQTEFSLQWHDTISEQARRSWNDLTIATEWAACGIAFLLMEKIIGYTVVRQARKGNGIDYWLGEYNTYTEFVHEKARLEVSGILSAEYESNIKARVKQKINQVSDDNVETYVIVVEFSRPLSWLERVR